MYHMRRYGSEQVGSAEIPDDKGKRFRHPTESQDACGCLRGPRALCHVCGFNPRHQKRWERISRNTCPHAIQVEGQRPTAQPHARRAPARQHVQRIQECYRATVGRKPGCRKKRGKHDPPLFAVRSYTRRYRSDIFETGSSLTKGSGHANAAGRLQSH